MSFKEAVEKELRELQEVLDAAKMKYRESLELANDFEAIVCLDQAVDLVPDYGDAWHELGTRYHGLQLFEKAEICFFKACKHGIRVESYLCLAEINLKQERYPWARNFFDRVLRKEPDNLKGLFGLAASYRGEENFMEASRVLGSVLELLALKESGADLGGWIRARRNGRDTGLVDDYMEYRDLDD